MYALISGYWYALILGIIIRTRAIYRIQITASLSDEDACTGSRVLSGVSISARGYDPLLFLWAFNLEAYAKTEMMTILLRTFSFQA